MQPSLVDALAHEIKHDIANRYFGFRKLIEDDKLALGQRLRQFSRSQETRLCLDLVRIYILLGDEGLIGEFLALATIPEQFFYDPYLLDSATIRQRLFQDVAFRGLTRKACFTNTLLDSYRQLAEHSGQYRKQYAELVAARQEISAEIIHFQRNNDLATIIGFLRALGETRVESDLQGGMEAALAADLERKLRIEPPEPVSHVLPEIPALPPMPAIKRQLLALSARACAAHPGRILEFTPAWFCFRWRRPRCFMPREK